MYADLQRRPWLANDSVCGDADGEQNVKISPFKVGCVVNTERAKSISTSIVALLILYKTILKHQLRRQWFGSNTARNIADDEFSKCENSLVGGCGARNTERAKVLVVWT